MHIPDGYLSPSTCAALYASAAPFWYVALQKVKRQMHTRLVPMVSLFAAFSFVVMMFNLPLPGGTTGHATGAAVAAIVLGPWAGMLAVSIALTIQALFFGDGGVTAIGANCLNIAIVGSLVAWVVYRTAAGSAPLESARRVTAAGIAGYVAINAAALITAIEFGLQPELFRDATGAPLYAPYPLRIAVPAMMIGHLTLAGIAEAVVTGGIVAWLQRSDPALLERAWGVTAVEGAAPPAGASLQRLWLAMGLLMLLTPLGLLAVGSAWGEWAPQDFTQTEARRVIAQGSLGAAPPAAPPAGLERLSSFWTAPFPDYAPPLLKSEAFGYVLSAMAGSGLAILAALGLGWFVSRGKRGDAA